MRPSSTQFIVIGVSGSGKTTLGRAPARHLKMPFLGADDFHTAEAKSRMARGEGLSNAERLPWLMRLRAELKRAYWETLGGPKTSSTQTSWAQTRFIYLKVPPALLSARLERRRDRYAGPSLLPSQLAAFEPPGDTEALIVPVSAQGTTQSVLGEVLARLEVRHAL